VGLMERIKRGKVKADLRAELVKENGERVLLVAIQNSPDGGLLIHRALEQAAR
jgi:hypothetical protein